MSTCTNEVITQRLFLLTQQHHRNCLRQMFLRYYEPQVVNGRHQPNPNWTVGMSKIQMNTLRLHLTWVLKGEVFHWTNEQIGKKMLKIFKKLERSSTSTFVKHVNK
jgi:hypothetical protein